MRSLTSCFLVLGYCITGGEASNLHAEELQQPLAQFKGHSSLVNCLAFSPDSKTLLSGGSDYSLQAWDLASGKHLRSMDNKAVVYSLSATTDAVYAACWDQSINKWSSRNGKLLQSIPTDTESGVISIAISPDNSRLAAVFGPGEFEAKILNLNREEKPVRLVGHKDGVWCVQYTTDGKKLLTGSYDQTVRVWDSETGKELKVLTEHDAPIECLAVSGDGRFAASGDIRGNILLWDLRALNKLAILKRHSSNVRSLCFGLDGKQLVSVSGDSFDVPGELKIWSTEHLKELRTLKPHSGAIAAVAISRDGAYLATASEDKTIKVWKALSILKGERK